MDELNMRQMPYSVEAEQSVIGSMLIDPRCVPGVLETISPADFFIPENRKIYEIIYSMFTISRTIDPVTVLDSLKTSGTYDEAGGREYLMMLMDITPTAANVQEYAKIVREKAILRTIAEAGGEIVDRAVSDSGGADEILEYAESRIYGIRHGHSGHGLVPVGAVIYDAYRTLNELAKNGGEIPGLPTGFSDLDSVISGLNDSDLLLLAARPGMGKTSFVLNVAKSAAQKTGKKVAIFSLEMSREQLVLRMLSSEALIDYKKLRTADLNDDEWLKLAHATGDLGSCELYLDDTPSIGVTEMKAKCRRLGDNLGLVVIDYLQLMQSGKRTENRVLEISEMTRGLKIMAKELNVPVLCCSQLSRAPEGRADKRPMLSDLRDSGAIEQDADIVMFLYRDDYYNKESTEPNVCECIIAKNRHGATGTVKMQWLGQYTRFSQQEKKYVLP